MRCLIPVCLAIALSQGSGVRVRADEDLVAPKSRTPRSSLKFPQFLSPTAKDSKSPEKTDSSKVEAPAAAPQPKAPSRVPSLDEMILFQPDRQGDWKPSQLNYTDVEFESADGTALHAWYCAADAPRAVVLYCHGNGGNISWMADYFEFLRTTHDVDSGV